MSAPSGKVVFSDLTNPNEAMADLPAGTVSADVVLAGTDTVAIGPADVPVTAGSETIVYAIGSAQDKTLGVVVQTIGGLAAAPGGVPAGNGGQAAATGVPAWLGVLVRSRPAAHLVRWRGPAPIHGTALTRATPASIREQPHRAARGRGRCRAGRRRPAELVHFRSPRTVHQILGPAPRWRLPSPPPRRWRVP